MYICQHDLSCTLLGLLKRLFLIDQYKLSLDLGYATYAGVVHGLHGLLKHLWILRELQKQIERER